MGKLCLDRMNLGKSRLNCLFGAGPGRLFTHKIAFESSNFGSRRIRCVIITQTRQMRDLDFTILNKAMALLWRRRC